MQWIDQMNQAVAYLEQHLCEEPDYRELARITAYPAGLFPRIFALIAGMPLADYLRQRRLTCAGYDLQHPGAKVIDVALKYGYSSPDAFRVAFKRHHGITPSQARQPWAKLRSFSPLQFAFTMKGVQVMKERMEHRKAFTVVGFRAHSTQVPDIWGKVKSDGTMEEILSIGKNQVSLGLCWGYDEQGHNLAMVAVESDAPAPAGLEAVAFPPLCWMVFEVSGPISANTLGTAWKQVHAEVIPGLAGKGRRMVPGLPTIETYQVWDETADHCRCEIMLPIEAAE